MEHRRAGKEQKETLEQWVDRLNKKGVYFHPAQESHASFLKAVKEGVKALDDIVKLREQHAGFSEDEQSQQYTKRLEMKCGAKRAGEVLRVFSPGNELMTMQKQWEDQLIRHGYAEARKQFEVVFNGLFQGVEKNLPEDNRNVMWYYRSQAQPPYIGSMADCEFPGADAFYCWCEIPQPPKTMQVMLNGQHPLNFHP